ANYENCPPRQLSGVAIVACMDLKYLRWQIAAQRRNLRSLEWSGRDHDVLRLDGAATRLQDHGVATAGFTHSDDLSVASQRYADVRGVTLEEANELILRCVPIRVRTLISVARQLQRPVRELKDERIPPLGAPSLCDLPPLQNNVLCPASRQIVAHRKASMPCANDYRVNPFDHGEL